MNNIFIPYPIVLLFFQPSLAYHTSAILASSLDTATLPYRVAEEPISLSVLTEALGNLGRKVTTPLELKILRQWDYKAADITGRFLLFM